MFGFSRHANDGSSSSHQFPKGTMLYEPISACISDQSPLSATVAYVATILVRTLWGEREKVTA